MDRELTRVELDELLPLFAVDALEGEEREQVARYVERDAAARAEVDSLREAASFLPHPPRHAPPSLWAGIEETLRGPADASPRPPVLPLARPNAVLLAESSPRELPPAKLLPRGSPPDERRPQPWSRRTKLLALAAAVALLLAVSVSAVLGVQVANQQDRIDALAAEMHADTVSRQAAMARTMPGAHSARLMADGDAAGQVVMLPDGSGWFVHSDLAALPEDRTYQLWAVIDDGAGGARYVSVGVLGREPGATAFRATAPVRAFAISEEPVGGASSPGTMVASGEMA
jgi:anti-sigma-K factor RskA